MKSTKTSDIRSSSAAYNALLEANLIVVDGETFDRFHKLFDAPARPNEHLRALMNLKAPWEA